MTGALPDWQPFDLDPRASTPVELSGMRGAAMVLLAAPAVDETGWAVRAAARIAEQRARRNGRLVLADVDLTHPRLHMELGSDNGEGVSDVILWGASLPRVARPVDRGFVFAPAGTAVADAAAVLEHPRWKAVLDGFDEAGAELFLYLPWDSPGRDSLLSRATNVVVLAAHPEVERLEALDVEGLRIGAVLGPVEESRTASPEADSGAEQGTPEGGSLDREHEAPDPPAPEVAEVDGPGTEAEGGEEAPLPSEAAVATDAPPPALDPSEPPPGVAASELRVEATSRRGLGLFVWIAILILAVAAGVVLLMGLG